MLGYGTLIVESAGQIQALNKIDYMPRPEEIYEALSELVFGEKGKTRATGMLAGRVGAADPGRRAVVSLGRGPLRVSTCTRTPPPRTAPTPPAGLVAAAAAAGLDVLALTDHDTTSGWAAAAAALPPGMSLVRGAEFSCVSPAADGNGHLGAPAGLPVRPRAPGDRRRAGAAAAERVHRLRGMTERMAADGFPVDVDTVLRCCPTGPAPAVRTWPRAGRRGCGGVGGRGVREAALHR